MNPPFESRPLSALPLPEAVLTAQQYLEALAKRIDRLFDHNDAGINKAARSSLPEYPYLTDANITELRDSWCRASSLIAYHCGGFYIPKNLRADTRDKIYKVLTCQQYGIYHSDMQMDRFIVHFEGNDGDSACSSSDITVTLATGWETACRAPLWSCARLPPWLIFPTTRISPDRQRELRKVVYDYMTRPPQRQHFRDWVFAYLYGVAERWFEDWIGSHWQHYKTLEVGLFRLKLFWQIRRPDVPFPVEVPNLDSRGLSEAADDEICSRITALANASGTNAGHWELASLVLR
jgi:hypothetical protein